MTFLYLLLLVEVSNSLARNTSIDMVQCQLNITNEYQRLLFVQRSTLISKVL